MQTKGVAQRRAYTTRVARNRHPGREEKRNNRKKSALSPTEHCLSLHCATDEVHLLNYVEEAQPPQKIRTRGKEPVLLFL